MNHPKISIIVPVYNVEKYLKECVESVLAQTFIDFELLLIDDGSTDSSGAICDEYAQKDTRVRVFHKENGGVSSARNLGFDNAIGKYVIFLDADDYWFNINALEQLYQTADENHVDIVRGEYKAVDGQGCDLFSRSITDKGRFANKVLDSVTFLKEIIKGEFFFVLCLVRRDALGNIRYNEKRSFLEDMELVSNLMLKSLSCVYLPLRFYAYRKIETSASNVPKIKNLEDSFAMCYVFHKLADQAKDGYLKTYYHYNSVMMYYWTLDTITLESHFPKRMEIIDSLDLKELQRNIYDWSKKTNERYPIQIKTSPLVGVWLFRIRHILGNILRKIKK